MKRKILATCLVLTTMCTVLTGCQGKTASGNSDTQNLSTQNTENEVTEEDITKVEYPVDITADLSEEKKDTVSAFVKGLAGVAIVEKKISTDDKLEELSDYDKALVYYFMMYNSEFSALDSFEQAGLLEETEVIPINGASDACDGYAVSPDQYTMAVGHIFQNGFGSDSAANDFLKELNNESNGVPLYDNGSYGVYNCLEYTGGELKNLSVSQTSETTVVIEGQVYLEIALEGGLYDIYVEAELDESSPFAGMTVTNVQVTCAEAME